MVEPAKLFSESQMNEMLRHQLDALRGSPGGGAGGSGGSMDTWQQSVEGRLQALTSKIDGQLKWLLIAFASGFIVLGGLMINRTDSLRDVIMSRADASIQSAAQTNERLARVETTISERGVPPRQPSR